MRILILICAALNCISCGSKNHHNCHVFDFVHVCLFSVLIWFMRPCRSELASVRLPIVVRVALAFSFVLPVFLNSCLIDSFPLTFDVLIVISGSEINEVKDGEVIKYPDVLSCGPLVPQGGWTLGGEDPKYYKKNKLWRTARREWPDVPTLLLKSQLLLLLRRRRRTLLPTPKRS